MFTKGQRDEQLPCPVDKPIMLTCRQVQQAHSVLPNVLHGYLPFPKARADD